jgi:hypothetical protein
MHSNNNYFESIHSKKFLFYSQLIERYRSIISHKEPTYLFLTSSTIKEKQRKEIFKLHILRSELPDLLVFDKKERFRNHETKFNISNSSSETLNQIKATNESIEGKIFNHSKQEAQPLRSEFRSESMSINLRDEKIPMAYSGSFLDKWNREKEQHIITNAEDSSSNYIDLENIMKDEEEIINHRTAAEPYQILNKNKLSKTQKKRRKTPSSLIIQEENAHFDQEKCLIHHTQL